MALERVASVTDKVRPAIVLLMGAGASVALGVPTMKGFSARFLDARVSGLTPKEKRTYNLLTAELGVDNDLEMLLLAANAMLGSQETSLMRLIEKTITPRPTARTRQGFRQRFTDRLSDIEAVRDRALNFMADLCFQFDRDKAVQMFGDLVPALSDRGYPVYTTNYDFALEHTADQLSVRLSDNFISKGHRWLWDPRMQFETANALALIKLHGSATWYIDDSGEIEKLLTPTERNTAGKRVRRLAIFPTRFKDINDQHFFSLYSHFLSALEGARCLVVVGHSLRDEYLSAAILHRLGRGDFSVIVVDPTFPGAVKRVCRPAPQGRSGPVTHVPLRLEAFADDLAALLRTTAPESLAAECAQVARLSKKPKRTLRLKGKLERLVPRKARNVVVELDAYVPAEKRPARVRAWLSAIQKAPSGAAPAERSTTFSHRFVAEADVDHISVGGIARGPLELRLAVPLYQAWLAEGTSVTLHVALLSSEPDKPVDVLPAHVLAKLEKPVRYSL